MKTQKKRQIRHMVTWQLKKRLNYLTSKLSPRDNKEPNEIKYLKYHIRKRGKVSKLVKRTV